MIDEALDGLRRELGALDDDADPDGALRLALIQRVADARAGSVAGIYAQAYALSILSGADSVGGGLEHDLVRLIVDGLAAMTGV